MSRRGSAKLRKAHHRSMLDAEKDAAEKARRRSQRRVMKRERAKEDALLAGIMVRICIEMSHFEEAPPERV